MHASLKDAKADNFTGDVRCFDISFFHHIAQGVKQNKFVTSLLFKLHGTWEHVYFEKKLEEISQTKHEALKVYS